MVGYFPTAILIANGMLRLIGHQNFWFLPRLSESWQMSLCGIHKLPHNRDLKGAALALLAQI